MQDDAPVPHPSEELHQNRHKFAVEIRKKNRRVMFEKKRQYFQEDPYHHHTHIPSTPIPQQTSPNAECYLPPKRQRPPSPPISHPERGLANKFDQQNLLYRTSHQHVYQKHEPLVPPQPITAGMQGKPREISLLERAYSLYSPKEHFQREFDPPSTRSTAILDQDLGDFIQEYLPAKLRIIDRRYNIDHFQQAIDDLKSGETLSVIQGAIVIRRLVSIFGSAYRSLIDRLVEGDVLPVLMNMMQYEGEDQSPQLKHEAAWVISNIASNDKYCHLIAGQGGIQTALSLIKGQCEHLALAGLWLLGNISADYENRFHTGILSIDGMRTIISLAESTTKRDIFTACTWIVVNLLMGDSELFPKEIEDGINFLCRSLELGFIYPNQNEFKEGLEALCLKMGTHMQQIAMAGVIPFLIELCRGGTPLEMRTYQVLFKILVTFSEGDETIAQIMLASGILDIISLWIQRGSDEIIQQSIFILSNLAACSTDNSERIMGYARLLQSSVHHILEGKSSLQLEACTLFINIALYGTPKSLFQCYARTHLIRKLFPALTDIDHNDLPLLNTFLELVERVLACGQLPQHLEEGKNVFSQEIKNTHTNDIHWKGQILVLTNHNDPLVHQRATFICQEYLGPVPIDQQQSEYPEGPNHELEKEIRRKRQDDDYEGLYRPHGQAQNDQQQGCRTRQQRGEIERNRQM